MEVINRSRWRVCGVALLMLIAAQASAQVEKPKKIEIRPKGEQKPEVVAPGPVAPNIPGVAATVPQGAPLKTTIEIDITSTSQTGDPAAQNWANCSTNSATRHAFESAGMPSRVTEKVRGSLRNVSVSGILSRSGELIVGNKSFDLSDKQKLEEWLEELKLYGAQGAPEGKPLWGLNREQFVIVNDQMTKRSRSISTEDA